MTSWRGAPAPATRVGDCRNASDRRAGLRWHGAGAKSLDLILNTVSAVHEIGGVLPMLAVDGRLVMMGVVTSPYTMPMLPLVFNRAGVVGSLIGGIKRTQVRRTPYVPLGPPAEGVSERLSGSSPV